MHIYTNNAMCNKAMVIYMLLIYDIYDMYTPTIISHTSTLHLSNLQCQQPLLHRVPHQQSIHLHRPDLAQPVHPVDSLVLRARVPPICIYVYIV